METAARLFLLFGFFTAATSLTFQARRALRFRRQPRSAPIGDPGRAVLYNFTIAMLPSHKESVSLHPVSFTAGAVLHAAVFASLTTVITSLFSPQLFDLARPIVGWIAATGVVACAFLFLRRFLDRELRAISVPDDFVASAAVGLFLIASAAPLFHRLSISALQFLTGFLFLYMPLGKLRHAVFFFLARFDLGRRLGWRGVYPPPLPAGARD